MRKLFDGCVAKVHVDRSLYRNYEAIRTSNGKDKERLNLQYRTHFKAKHNEVNNGILKIKEPIIVWQPYDMPGKYIGVSNMEIWFAVLDIAFPINSEGKRCKSGIEVTWENVYLMGGTDTDVISLINSYGSIEKPIAINQIAESRGYKKIDLYGPTDEKSKDEDVEAQITETNNGDLSIHHI